MCACFWIEEMHFHLINNLGMLYQISMEIKQSMYYTLGPAAPAASGWEHW